MSSDASSLPPVCPLSLVRASQGQEKDSPHTAAGAADEEELHASGWAHVEEGSDWLVHGASGWLCNPAEKVFFHAEKHLLVPAELADASESDAAERAGGGSAQAAVLLRPTVGATDASPEVSGGRCSGDSEEDAGISLEELQELEEEEEGEPRESDEDSDLMLDLEDDLDAGTAQTKGTAEGKDECEDRYVTRKGLPLGIVAGSSEGLCYFSAVYDGHAGSDCAEYAASHLHKNLLSCYRQIHRTVERRRQEEALRHGGKRRKQQHASQWLQQLNLSTEALRHEERRLSVEVEALVRSCFSAFSLTDKNYLGRASSSLAKNAGTTACLAIFFGPDDSGVLQLITAHAGDSRAVLCRDGEAIRLTEDHKPNSPAERKRIEKAGGQVMQIQGVWRVMASDQRGGRTVGLATARALGDSALKRPKPLVISNPTVHVHTLHFDRDAFLVLASDGIFDVLSDEEVVKLIFSRLPRTPAEASQLVVDEAVARGGTDDKTCTVIYFRWRKDLFPPSEETEDVGEQLHEEAEEAFQQILPQQAAGSLARSEAAEQIHAFDAAPPSSPPGQLASRQPLSEAAEGPCAAVPAGQRGGGGVAAEERCSGDASSDKRDPRVGTGAVEEDEKDCGAAAAARADEAERGLIAVVCAATEAAEERKGRGLRSGGLEEIAAVKVSLDVEAFIRKRKREQQMEAEATAAAAAAEAEAEDDFDIFGGGSPPKSPNLPEAPVEGVDSD
ncbi:protein phosphatase 1F [Cyclospora cayetanensis]|uniref:Protein phosphatase 1F n=1 Tax=Cyclospora cayetanensis TaxID=88456 RepID=A0A6P6S2Q8_9EIME|nr:protein phosphatase 1F [Cyclospora cayetanensis]